MVKLFSPTARVKLNSELRRVELLPRRLWKATDATHIAAELGEILRTPAGAMSLRPVQGVALYETGTEPGLFGPLRVGAGKTLISVLASEVASAKRPLLLIPAKLLEKTRRDTIQLRQHWSLPEFLRILTYEWLGRAQAAQALERYQPDLVILDECHKLKNRKAAVTRRVMRYFNVAPHTRCVAMSGTITKRSLHDYAHILRWCLKAGAPVPEDYNDLELWADALDERKGQQKRADPGALQVLCNDAENELWRKEPRRAARQAFRRRLVETPGVVATEETAVDASLTATAIETPHSPAIDDAFARLRSAWETPDGWPCADGLSIFRHAREIALGFYYVWNPRPPAAWLIARQAWCRLVREVLKHSRTLDSELMIKQAIRAKIKQGEPCPEYEAWEEIKNTFEPNTEPRWLCDSVLELCAAWLRRERGIVWTEHTHFAERLSSFSGVPYFGRAGQTRAKKKIEDHRPGEPMICSVQSNSEGRNLQAWSKNLIVSMPPNGAQVEQLWGRTHRDGQEADEVTFDVLIGCAEHVAAWWQARADAQYVQDTTGQPQKILITDHDVPEPDAVAFRQGARWQKR